MFCNRIIYLLGNDLVNAILRVDMGLSETDWKQAEGIALA